MTERRNETWDEFTARIERERAEEQDACDAWTDMMDAMEDDED